MKNATTRRALVVWGRLTWLVPVACFVPLGVLAYVAAEAARQPVSTRPWSMTRLWFSVSLLFGSWEVLFLAAGVVAATLARRGAYRAALVVFAAVWAAALSAAGPLDWSSLRSSQWTLSTLVLPLVLALPVVVAASLAVVGLPLLRGGPIAQRVVVIALLVVPLVRFVFA